jgi:hypothetical protein
MKKLSIGSVLVFVLGIAVFAQTNQSVSCPTIDVRGGGLARSNETTYFIADVDMKGKDLKVEYIWTVGGGEIVEGQGTEKIAIKLSSDNGYWATVEIKGFPEACSNTSTDSRPAYHRLPEPIKVAEFLAIDSRSEKTWLEELRKALVDDRNAQVYVVVRFKEDVSENQVAQKLKKLGSFLMKELVLKADRIRMTQVFGEKETIEIWFVPSGASYPQDK